MIRIMYFIILGVSSSLSQVSPVIQQIQSNESALLNKTDLYCHTSTLSPVSSSDKSSISNEAYNKNHIYAEKKRRQNIKQGFDTLRTLINTSSPGHKVYLMHALLNKIEWYLTSIYYLDK